ncbi:hypothetical protein PVK06_047104 [Gossypium arboreum]|uniref:Uncharacterized protein n=1 Tax=Gossypium arboreum TaxID=29729 RepID=A0ABR0MCV9_GOSAR|nr:hypothetical protein PVK06_047104 [Gossypium arboreum]
MFNEITKAIRRGLNTNVTLPHRTYFPYLCRRLGISSHRDTPVTSNLPISYRALHHTRYHSDANIDKWLKSDHPAEHKNDDIDAAFEDLPTPEHAPPLTSSSQAAQPSLEVNNAMLYAIHSLNKKVQGLQEEVRSHREDVNSQISNLESQMASLLACFPLTPPFSPPLDD